MKTRTLRDLTTTFENEERYLEASALLESDPERQIWFRQHADRITMIAAAIRSEISARSSAGERAPDEAQRFDDYLHRVLADYLDLGQEPAPPRACRASRTSRINTRTPNAWNNAADAGHPMAGTRTP